MYDYDNIIGLLCQIHIAMCANKQMYVKKRNSMIKVAVCDDELSVLSELSVLIDTYRVEQNQEISYTMFQSPLELLAEVEKGMCWDVLFLDILMPGENGIDVAKEIRQFDTKVNIIFLTSSSEFAVQSYMVDAYFYQLKPIWKESFFQLMNSVVAECERTEPLYLILKCKTGITRIDIDKLKDYVNIDQKTLRMAIHYETAARLQNLSRNKYKDLYDIIYLPVETKEKYEENI